jgi:hypothetical protein
MNWKAYERKQSWPLEGLRKATKSLAGSTAGVPAEIRTQLLPNKNK